MNIIDLTDTEQAPLTQLAKHLQSSGMPQEQIHGIIAAMLWTRECLKNPALTVRFEGMYGYIAAEIVKELVH